jgi:nitrogenase molybdenum-cofactor synthesis protein NifE
MSEAYFITAGALAARGPEDVPPELISGTHLIYSSPAALAFNSPGAQGFGVKRAGLAVPGSVMLLVSPGCCGRNTGALRPGGDYDGRMFYLLLDDTDIVTGRHLTKIPDAVREVCAACKTAPSAVMLCITCVDALLGTDMDRVCRKAQEAAGVPVLPCYMYALTREGRLPPMTAVRQTVYSLLEKRTRQPDACNILGYFSPLRDDCELYSLLRAAGVRKVRELSRCADFQEYEAMAEANFNLVLDPESRLAARDMEEKLGIPSVELTRLYELDKIENQYRLLGQVLGVKFDDSGPKEKARRALEALQRAHSGAVFAVGECANADPFELSLALCRWGFRVSEIYGTVSAANFPYLRRLAGLSPETRIYSNLHPTMLYYKETPCGAAIGRDAAWYHPHAPSVLWAEERQPFGYAGAQALLEALNDALSGKDEA